MPASSENHSGWVGFDLDGTLAHHAPGDGIDVIGKPIPRMINRLKRHLKEGYECRIFTARAEQPGQDKLIHDWLEKQGLPRLAVTNKKDYGMLKCFDDRAEGVLPNTGITVSQIVMELTRKQAAAKA